MATQASGSLDFETLRRAIEDRDADTLIGFYAEDAEVRTVNKNDTPSSPRVLRGKEEISEYLRDVYGRGMTHRVEGEVVGDDRVAFFEACEYPDGMRVLGAQTLELRDGKIVRHVNVEGAAFREDGALLLGLRFPVSAEGHPILVELEGIERLFEPGDSLPDVRGFWTVDAVGREGTIAGVRDLALLATAHGEELHLVTGNVDSRDKESVLIQDYPGGRNTVATHFLCVLPSDVNSGVLEGEFVREFPDLPRVEGIAITEGGRFFYVTDEDEGVHLRLTRLLAD